MKEFGWEKNIFWQNDSCENLDIFSLIRLLYMHRWCLNGPVPLWADQLLPQLLLEQFDTLPIQCRHIDHMYEGVWFRKKSNFWQNDSCENLDIFSLIRLLYLHRWCLNGPINSYYSFWWNNLILCLYNGDTLNICMKEFGWEIYFLTKLQQWELRQFFPDKVFEYA